MSGILNRNFNIQYEDAGFTTPDFLVNQYGIRIYIGTRGEDDWCVLVPMELVENRAKRFGYSTSELMDAVYLAITEERALSLARRWTEYAKGDINAI